MNDKTRKRLSNLCFILAAVSGLIALSAQLFHFGGFGVKATFGIGMEVIAVIGLLLRAKDIVKWRGRMLAQGIQEANAKKYCPKQRRRIRTRFLRVDFHLCCVKILANPSGFAAFLPCRCKNRYRKNSAT